MSTLLTIDEEKVREGLEAAAKPQFVVTISQIGAVQRPDAPMPSFEVSGTTPFSVAEGSAEARTRLTLLRRRIVESGFALKSASELDVEIEEAKIR